MSSSLDVLQGPGKELIDSLVVFRGGLEVREIIRLREVLGLYNLHIRTRDD